jgi:hypothetical protein
MLALPAGPLLGQLAETLRQAGIFEQFEQASTPAVD